MKKVTLLIPVYNEEATLPVLYKRLLELMARNGGYEWEMLFVNDGSSDRSLDCLRRLRAEDPRVNYVNLSRNFGKEIAMLAGFDYATGDCCVVMDADLQDPPELVDQMLKYWEEGYDDIYARRRTRGEESWLRRRLSLAFYSLLQKMSRIDILPNVGDMLGQRTGGGMMSPGLDFAFGMTGDSYIDKANERGWLLNNDSISTPATTSAVMPRPGNIAKTRRLPGRNVRLRQSLVIAPITWSTGPSWATSLPVKRSPGTAMPGGWDVWA